MSDFNKNDKRDLEFIIAVIAATPGVLKAINEILDTEITLPNIPFKVYDWFLWDTLAQCNGWRLQQNQITKHCRIVDPDDMRRAWGTKNGMWKALESLKNRI